jgi:hypothetical protein
MQQRWWLVVVAVVGVGLAVALFPRPDTGGSVAVAPGDGADGASAFGRPPPSGVAATNPNVSGDRQKPPLAPPGANLMAPGEAEQLAKRARPESIYASKLVSPFSAMRYSLAKKEDAAASALVEEIGTMMADLRKMRLDPDSMTWAELQAKTDAMVKKVSSGPWGKDDTIVKAVERYEAFLAEYEVAKAAPQNPAPAGGEEVP